MVIDMIVNGVGYSQDVIFRCYPRPTSLAVLHAAPERPPAPHAVRNENIRFVNQLKVAALRLNEMKIAFKAAVDATYN